MNKNGTGYRETQTLELKKSLSEKREIGETVSAFSNTNDGVILVGIAPDGEVVGVNAGKKSLEDLANLIKQNTNPKVYPSIEEHKIDGKDIIKILVSKADKKPVWFKGRAFQRVGRANHTMSPERIAELMTRSGQIPHWDERICEDADLNDIDADKVKWFLEKAKSERGSDIDPGTQIEEVLERLGLIREGQMTNAAILLFGKNPQRFFRQAETKCGRFRGTEPIDFIDMKEFGGSIIDQKENAVTFVMDHIEHRVRIVGTERVEEWEYPIEAIREAITNAICHRDYETPTNVQVRIFDDRIEVWGCGSLPHPLTVEDLERPHRSIPRNPVIGNCFFRIKFIEQWGTGTNRIISVCRSHGFSRPFFEQRADGLLVTLEKIKFGKEEKAIIDYLIKEESISTKKCMSLLNSSRGTAQRYISSLERRGIISRQGGGRNTHYVLT